MSPRGDSTNLRNYARALKEFLNIESIIVYNLRNSYNHSKTIDALKGDNYEVIGYKTLTELNNIARLNSITHSYFMIDGKYKGIWVKDTINLIHAVFNYYEPYGDKHAYVSEWLFEKNLNSKVKLSSKIRAGLLHKISGSPYKINTKLSKCFVPHCVFAENGDGERFRKKFKIPETQFLVGRIGGFDQFDDPEAQKSVFETIRRDKRIFFVFVNTKNFGVHENLRYINWLSYQDKWDFYDACDLLWNGRLMGESFGFSIVEPLMINKPILAPSIKRNIKMDRNHIKILEPLNLLYSSSEELTIKTLQLLSGLEGKSHDYKDSVERYKPEQVINQFQNHFLK